LCKQGVRSIFYLDSTFTIKSGENRLSATHPAYFINQFFQGGKMELSRRDFLKTSGLGVGAAFLLGAIKPGKAQGSPPKALPLKKQIGEKTSICPYDGTGCGFVIAAENGKILNIEGDPDHPINQGSACAKGASMKQLYADNPWRLSKVLYRKAGGTDWEEKDWNWAIDQIARKIKDTRDASFTNVDSGGNIVNRTEAIGNFGGSALDNEECYLLSKMTRAIGVVYLEHHARI
jgi:formate dehydrogenase major subunit